MSLSVDHPVPRVGTMMSSGPYAPLKGAADTVAALLLLVVAMPVIFAIAVLVKLCSRGPVLYWQTRLGLDGRPFTIFKIRSMHHDCEGKSGPRWATAADDRIFPLGRLLRATHLDELPQLWNVLRGDMSLVGPRPERPVFVSQLELALPRYGERMRVRPGVTGLAQVQLPPDTDLESVRRKLACDLHYVANLGPWMDLRIVLATALCSVAGLPFEGVNRVLRLPSLAAIEQADGRATEGGLGQVGVGVGVESTTAQPATAGV